MADSKRGGRKGAKGGEAERLTPLNFALNAIGAFVAAPALFVTGVVLLQQNANDSLNTSMFLGLVCFLIGVFLLLLGGLRVREHLVARKRFKELLEGDRKSAVVQNLDELNSLARSLGPDYRKQLDGRLAEWGIKR